MAGKQVRPGFFDLDERYARLSQAGDPLDALVRCPRACAFASLLAIATPVLPLPSLPGLPPLRHCRAWPPPFRHCRAWPPPFRHCRTCSGNPELRVFSGCYWMPGSSPGMTGGVVPGVDKAGKKGACAFARHGTIMPTPRSPARRGSQIAVWASKQSREMEDAQALKRASLREAARFGLKQVDTSGNWPFWALCDSLPS